MGIHIFYILHKELRKRLSACTLSGPETQDYVPYPLGTAKGAVLPKSAVLFVLSISFATSGET